MAALLVVAGLAYFAWPRAADLRHFDPAAVGARETAMWRHYYERERLALFLELYGLSRSEYGFSPWDSLRIAWHAARAAITFQPTRSRQEAQAALPMLEDYFRVLLGHTGAQFDVTRAARLELDWWQLRRERATPDQYGDVIAGVEAELYGVRVEALQASCRQRAALMRQRDERGDAGMAPADWDRIQRGLTQSYQLLAAAVAGVR